MRAVRATVICEECVRIEYSPTGRFCDWPSLFAVHGPGGRHSASDPRTPAAAVHTISVDAAGREIVAATPRLRLTFRPDGSPPGPTNLEAIIRHASPPPGVESESGSVRWTPGTPNRHNLGGTLETLDGLRGPADIGHGLLSRDGWFLLDDSHTHLLIDGWVHRREDLGLAHNTDWYLFAYGEDYGAAFRAFAQVAGRVPLPRRYALGSWYSRYWPYTGDQYRGIVAEYHQHGFPLDVLVMDMDWHKEGWTGWSWNRDLLPDAENLIHWLHEQGLAVTLNLHPADGVGPHEDRYTLFMRALGKDAASKDRTPFDAASRAYMRALFDEVHRPLEQPPDRPNSGVDFWWVDWQQDRFTRSITDLTNLRWLNHLYFQHSTSAGRRGLGFSRWAGWGDHRHPIHFSGDAHTGWAMLAFQVPFTVAAGNVGCFFWSHDIGGHFGPRLEEATARWVQFGALSAALRLHSARSHSLDRRPWTYESRFCDSMRQSLALRAQLMPYLYTSARQSAEGTIPLLRPMYLAAPADDRAYECPQQYLLGPHLLAAPVASPGLGERCVSTQRVWFPNTPSHKEGAGGSPPGAWYDWFTAERHEPGDEIIAAADIDRTPLFCPGGILIPMQPMTHRPATEPIRTLVLRCFPGAHGQLAESVLYEDDGVSANHESGGFATTPLRAHWEIDADTGRARAAIEVGPAEGEFNGQVLERGIVLEIGGVEAVHGATTNGAPAVSEHDRETAGGLARVSVPPRGIRDTTRIEIEFSLADSHALAERARIHALDSAFGAVRGGGGGGTGEAGARVGLRHAVLARYAACREDDSPLRASTLAIGAGIALSRADVYDARRWRLVDSRGWIDDGRVLVRVIDRSGPAGRHERVVDERVIAFVGDPALPSPVGLGKRAASILLSADPLAPPPPGLRATRLIRCILRIEGEPITLETTAASVLTPLTRFLVAGPFDWHWSWSIADRHEPPELPSEKARHIAWSRAHRGDRLAVDFTKSFHKRGLAYARTSILSTRPQRAALIFEDAGDKIEAFLNGVKVYSQDGYDAPSAAISRADITLRSGPNDLLIKASECGSGWGFTVGIEGETSVAEEYPGEEVSATLPG